jgi:hypothetical protein
VDQRRRRHLLLRYAAGPTPHEAAACRIVVGIRSLFDIDVRPAAPTPRMSAAGAAPVTFGCGMRRDLW